MELAPPSWTLKEAAHLLNRAGFGATLPQTKRVHQLGRHQAVKHLIESATSAEMPAPPAWARREALQLEHQQYREARRQLTQRKEETTNATLIEEIEEQRRELNRQRTRNYRNQATTAVSWWFQLMCTEGSGLREQMTLFWHDHFATGLDKVRNPGFMVEQNQLLRQHALGNFPALVHEISENPAMVFYLDLHRSTKEHPNENFARELMELFVLGEGNYTETDVQELARALTGYSLSMNNGVVNFLPERHDSDPKTIFGIRGNFSPTQAINLVLNHEQTPLFLAKKLWTWFAGSPPNNIFLHRLAARLLEVNFEIAPFLESLFLSPEFYHPVGVGSHIKSPIQLLATFCRQFGLTSIPEDYLVAALAKLGQIPFLPPNVSGWNHGRNWIHGDVLLARYNILAELLTPGWEGPAPRGNLRNAIAVQNIAQSMQNWHGPDWNRVFPVEQRQLKEQCLQDLLFVLWGSEEALPPLLQERLQNWQEQNQALTDEKLRELAITLTASPQYQLC